MNEELDDLYERIQNACLLLHGWDGYYDPDTGRGNTKALAELIERAYTILQGESWRDTI